VGASYNSIGRFEKSFKIFLTLFIFLPLDGVECHHSLADKMFSIVLYCIICCQSLLFSCSSAQCDFQFCYFIPVHTRDTTTFISSSVDYQTESVSCFQHPLCLVYDRRWSLIRCKKQENEEGSGRTGTWKAHDQSKTFGGSWV
jgi:hypothetical protein